jgi:hypothetical protein
MSSSWSLQHDDRWMWHGDISKPAAGKIVFEESQYFVVAWNVLPLRDQSSIHSTARTRRALSLSGCAGTVGRWSERAQIMWCRAWWISSIYTRFGPYARVMRRRRRRRARPLGSTEDIYTRQIDQAQGSNQLIRSICKQHTRAGSPRYMLIRWMC